MKKEQIKKALAKATAAALPQAIKDHARYRAGDLVREAARPEPADDDSGEYPAVPAQSVNPVPLRPSMINGIRVNYAGPSRKK